MLAFAETGQGLVVMINANDNSGMMNRIVEVVADSTSGPSDHHRAAATKAVPPPFRSKR